ncbi:MAG: BatA domain-containing protein [Ignavibacteria bacterium]|jgi:hypothetical protein|nr:BatA domain-containing protein [Ignavibacteria bacterium]
MNFINPIVLFGLLAATMPIILHLLNLRKLKTVEFSSLQFLKEMQKNKIRRIKLKQIILLILRTLLIVSIVLAFARPAIDGTITGFESFAKSSSVILIDNSFSMDYSDENGNRFNQMKRTVNEILETMKEGDEVVIIEMANPTDSKIYEFARNKDLLKDVLEKIKLSYRPADIDKSMKLAGKMLDQASNFSKDIFIVSDAQPNIFEQTEIEKIDTEHSAIYLIPIGYSANSNSRNSSVDSLNIISRIFQINKSVEVEGYVHNNSNNIVNGTTLALSFNRDNVAQRSFDLQPNQIRSIPIGAIPATAGVFTAAIELENDAFMEDNIRYFGFIIPDKPNIALFSNTNTTTDFINIAISATGKDGFAKVNHFPSNQVASANLSQFDLVLLANGNYSSSDFNILKQYVNNGGNAFLFANTQTDANVFANAMLELGFGNVKTKEFSQSQPSQFTTTDKMHPLFDGVFKIDNDARGVVESPKIYKAMPALAGQSMIEMAGGTFLAENILGDGKLLYCAVPPTLEWSNFPITGIFPTIIIRSVAYLGSHPELSYNFEIGKNTQVMIQKKYSTGGNFRIIDPNGNEFLRQAAMLPSGAVLDFDDMNLPGVYTIYNSNNVVVGLISLNLQASESDFTIFTTDELTDKIKERISDNTKITIIDKLDDVADSIARTRTGTELWRLFILLALLLAIAEMLVQKNFKNDNIA